MLPIARNRTQQTLLRSLPDFRYDVDRMFDEFLSRTGYWRSDLPPSDVREDEDSYVIEMDLPGFNRDDIDISLEQGLLTISGEHRADIEEQPQEHTYHTRERMRQRFTRSFTMPTSVDVENVAAEFDSGVLRVTLPKAEESKARRIQIGSGSRQVEPSEPSTAKQARSDS